MRESKFWNNGRRRPFRCRRGRTLLSLRRIAAGISDANEVFEKAFALILRHDRKHFTLKGQRNGAGLFISLSTFRQEPDAMSAAIGLVRPALDVSGLFHALE